MVDRIKQYAAEGDLMALLIEAQDALDAIRQGSAGLRPDVDPLAEAKRLHEALEAAYQLGEQAYPGSRT